ncbi:MAG: adenylyltransferase/cytidyltransferase family protein [Treponema sp.]|nr:adenylyltransferase/cytidyltransferase family protein [Treponema sp.]
MARQCASAAGSTSETLGNRAEAPAEAKRAWCAQNGIAYRVLGAAELSGFPYAPPPADAPREPGVKRVVVTGCFDWLHSGHVRFFEEAAAYGELNVVIGSDANVRLLKGEGHPLIGELERRFVVGSMRSVTRCLVSSGSGWMDAEPEIRTLGIERYVVNEDGDKPDKRRFCAEHGIEYLVLKRLPKEGLPRRASTDLRGF